MGKRILGIVVTIGFFGWLGLVVIQWQFGLGNFARSPQQLVLAPGRRAIVGGGRAIVGFVANKREEVTLEVRCADATTRIDLTPDEVSGEVCGVRVRWIEETDPVQVLSGRSRFEISWAD